MIRAPKPSLAATEDNGRAVPESDGQSRDEAAIRKLMADADGRHFLKWLMAMTDLEGMSGTLHREGQRSIGYLFKLLCDSVDPSLYAGLVAERTLDNATAEARAQKVLAEAQAGG